MKYEPLQPKRGRRVVQFYAGGPVKKKARVKKARGGTAGPRAGGPPPMPPMPDAPVDPMAARMSTGVVGRARAPRRATVGGSLAGALGGVR